MSEDDKVVVRRALDVLIEHFDTARIFVTRHDPGSDVTESHSEGRGNAFAQSGQVKDWILECDQDCRNQSNRSL